MKLIRRRIVDDVMDVLVLGLHDVIYPSEARQVERSIWDVIQEGLGLNDTRWDFHVNHHWIGWVK